MAQPDDWWTSFFHGPWTQVQAGGYAAERTRAEVDFIVKVLGLTVGERVLDVPCGEGRHAIELAARGLVGTGVDFNAAALAVARERARAAGVQVEFREADMREVAFSRPFDAALCFFGSFGYFSDEDNVRFARAVGAALRPRGRFLIDTHVMESLLPRFQARGWGWTGEPGTSIRVLEERRWDLQSRRIQVAWTFIQPDGTLANVQSSIRIYAYAELCDLLRAAGFERFQGVETLTDAPFALGSSRLSLIATKS
jgi:SAM-dependent methyltransferase